MVRESVLTKKAVAVTGGSSILVRRECGRSPLLWRGMLPSRIEREYVMAGQITLKNYRCFADQAPARIDLRPGFTAFVGVNNAGKSTLLRFFHETRQIWESIVASPRILLSAMQAPQPLIHIGGSSSVTERLFSNANERDMSITFDFPYGLTGIGFPLREVLITVSRTHPTIGIGWKGSSPKGSVLSSTRLR